MTRNIIHLIALTTLMTVGLSELAQGQELQILDYGIYTARVEKILNEPNSPTGQARIMRTDLAKETNVIPAVLNTKFGFRFKVLGPPQGTMARLRLRFTFPEMTNPTNGKASSSYEVAGDVPVAPKEQGMFWDFVHPWEMRPGKWTMSLYSGDRLLVQKTFTVVEDTKSGHLSASQVTWKEHFGWSTADTNTLFSLMAHGYFRAESTNVQSVVDAWLKEHPKAIVFSVSTGGPVMTGLPSSRFAYVWVVQGGDNLNVELVRRGCLAAETQILNPDEKPEVPQKDYESFVQTITKAGESAKTENVGIWRDGRK